MPLRSWPRRRPGQPDDHTPRFRVWRAGQWHWKWECSYCWPPATGQRFGPLAWALIVSVSGPKHFQHRQCHHNWVALRCQRPLL